jgi:uncharacterized protein (TIGR03435 family)
MLSVSILFFGLFISSTIHAQTTAAPGAADAVPHFAVATIKPTDPKAGQTFQWSSGPDGFSTVGVSLHLLLLQAFNIEEERLLGEPASITSKRYDIDAKVDSSDIAKLDSLSTAQRGQMLAFLLEDRFNLKFHHETRTLPVYALAIAKGGSKLATSKLSPPGTWENGSWTSSYGPGRVDAQRSSIEFLIKVLSSSVGHHIIDKTGLSGTYDFKLRWTPDTASEVRQAPAGWNASDDIAPSLFTALKEQLGLKLEPQKAPVDVIVIDHIESPSPN